MEFVYFVALMCCANSLVAGQTGIELGYSNVNQDTINGETVLEYGAVPTWLSGKRLVISCQ